MKTTFAQRKAGEPVTNTNERVLERANEEMNALQEEQDGEKKRAEKEKWRKEKSGRNNKETD